MKVGIDRLISPNEKVIELEVLPFASSHTNILESREYLIALLLKNLKSFNKLISDVRTDIKLEKIFNYPASPTIKSLVNLEYDSVSTPQSIILKSKIANILDTYKLSQNWELSLTLAVLTHHLPIPYPNSSINLHVPIKNNYKPKNLTQLSNNFSAMARQFEIIRYPAIYFTERTKPQKLINWINKNRKAIDYMNRFLPETTTIASKLDIRTERVATVAIIFKQDGTNSWSKMVKEIDKWDKNDKEGISDFFGKDGLPTTEDLRLCFNSYMKLVGKFDVKSET